MICWRCGIRRVIPDLLRPSVPVDFRPFHEQRVKRTRRVARAASIVRSVCAGLLLTSVSGAVLPGQAPAGRPPGAWLIGGTVGIPAYEGMQPGFFIIGAHATQATSRRPGLDFSVSTMPRVLVMGVLPLGARAGLVLPFALSENVLLLPGGGASMVAAFGFGTGEAVAGLHAGASVVMFGSGSTGIRAGLTSHRFRDAYDSVWLLEFGFVRHRRR